MLLAAVAASVSGTLCARKSNGFSRWGYSLGALSSYAVATVLMAWLVQRLPIGVVYAVWTGAAAVVLLLADTIVYKLATSRLQLAGMAITLCGVALLGTAVH